jgi:hypothetical protein
VYKVAFDVLWATSGISLRAFFGQDQSGGSAAELSGGITPDQAWQRYVFSWTPSASVSSPVHFAVRRDTMGTSEVYLDNLVVWDSTSGWADKGIVSSSSAYNADGEIAASILPPGDPANNERPLVTTVAFDPAGRTVASVTNGASGAYAAAVLGTAGLAAYVPLDERVGTDLADKKSGGALLTSPASLTRGVAGGIDEARTGIRLTGANG